MRCVEAETPGTQSTDAGPAATAPAGRASSADVLFAPLAGIRRPIATARRIRGASILALLGAMLCWSLLIAVYAIFTFIRTEPDAIEYGLFMLAKVWLEYHAFGPFGWLEAGYALATGLSMLAMLLLAFIQWPVVLRSGEAIHAFRAALAAVLAGLGYAAVLVVLHGEIIVRAFTYYRESGSSGLPMNVGEPLRIFGVFASIALWTGIVGVITRALRDPPPAAVRPRCEFCGYDLTHVTAEGRCPECAADANRSLEPELQRRGVDWERREPLDLIGWAPTTVAVLFSPREFYRALHVRGDISAATWFARFTSFCFVPTAATAMLIFYLVDRYSYLSDGGLYGPFEGALLGMVLVAGAATPLLMLRVRRDRRPLPSPAAWLLAILLLGVALPLHFCEPTDVMLVRTENAEYGLLALGAMIIPPVVLWYGHRMFGSLMALLWLLTRRLPETSAAWKIIAYESAFVWTFGLVWWPLGMSYSLWSDWPQNVFGQSFWFGLMGMPGEPALLILSTIVLFVVALLRYQRAAALVRWSNF